MFRKTIALLGILTAVAGTAALAQKNLITEPFAETYAMSQGGTVGLKNICGDVRFQSWDRDAVMVEAIKSAFSRRELAEARIVIEQNSRGIDIKTEYPNSYQSFSCAKRDDDGGWNRRGDRERLMAASIDYIVTVPRQVRIDQVELVNGNAMLVDMDGDFRVSTVNGKIEAEDLSGLLKLSSVNGKVVGRRLGGDLKLSTVNGTVEMTFDDMSRIEEATLDTVNGTVLARMPSNPSAELRADTVHGDIDNDFGLEVEKGRYVGSRMRARMGVGGPVIRMSSVNGGIRIVSSR